MPTKPLRETDGVAEVEERVRALEADHRAARQDALQRLREFHPRFEHATDAEIASASFTTADAHLAIAREHGFESWERLSTHMDGPERRQLDLPQHERITDAPFRRAVDLADSGDLDGLRAHLRAHPGLVRQRMVFEGGNYFRDPALLEFVAQNPVRRDRLPPNIVEIARLILDAGGKDDRRSVDAALNLVSSGRAARTCGVQIALIDLLCDHGADPDAAMLAALGHGEFEAVEALLRRGARLDLVAAAAMGRVEDARGALASADGARRHLALALAAQHGHADIVRLLLDAGEDPNRYNPVGCHAHSTPLHQAALAGHLDVVRLLVERGAERDIEDIHFHATPLGWAEYAERNEVAAFLRASAAEPPPA